MDEPVDRDGVTRQQELELAAHIVDGGAFPLGELRDDVGVFHETGRECYDGTAHGTGDIGLDLGAQLFKFLG